MKPETSHLDFLNKWPFVKTFLCHLMMNYAIMVVNFFHIVLHKKTIDCEAIVFVSALTMTQHTSLAYTICKCSIRFL